MPTQQQTRRHGDRRDGMLLRDLDPMHFIMPMIYPNRCDNEAFISETVDLLAISAYLDKLNVQLEQDGAEDGQEVFRYTLFHIIVTAMLKTITLRPKMNRFIVNRNTYQRNEVSGSFVVKKRFSDNGEEALAIIHSTGDDTLASIHEKIREQVDSCRSDKLDESTENMDIVNKLPRWVGKAIGSITVSLDKHGHVPQTFIESDPYYTSVVLTNLGSIHLHSGYHHLTNWGTNSVFVAVGERKKRPFFNDDGTFDMRDSLDLGLTIDERIADGYYYSRTVKLFLYLLSHPELLEESLETEVEIP